jgi:hypothetical protein
MTSLRIIPATALRAETQTRENGAAFGRRFFLRFWLPTRKRLHVIDALFVDFIVKKNRFYLPCHCAVVSMHSLASIACALC